MSEENINVPLIRTGVLSDWSMSLKSAENGVTLHALSDFEIQTPFNWADKTGGALPNPPSKTRIAIKISHAEMPASFVGPFIGVDLQLTKHQFYILETWIVAGRPMPQLLILTVNDAKAHRKLCGDKIQVFTWDLKSLAAPPA